MHKSKTAQRVHNMLRSGFKIRKATIEDTDAIAKLWHQYDLHEHALDKRVEITPESEYRKQVREFFKDKYSIYIVAEVEGRIVGVIDYITYKRGTKRIGVLSNVFVMESYRGKGIGSSLADYVMNKMEAQHCKPIKSGVRVKNKEAQRFWEKRGFEINYNSIVDYAMKKE